MVMHMGVVAVAAPLLALGLAGTRCDPLRRLSPAALAMPVTVFELLVVWGWHAPAAHEAARHTVSLLILEQGSFLFAGLLLWLTALAPLHRAGVAGRGAGVLSLFLTSMHMTLLGSLLALAPRLLYHPLPLSAVNLARTPLEDQALGGLIMLAVGGAAYLLGAIVVLAPLLRERLSADSDPDPAGGWRLP
jgi:putative membrane protein